MHRETFLFKKQQKPKIPLPLIPSHQGRGGFFPQTTQIYPVKCEAHFTGATQIYPVKCEAYFTGAKQTKQTR